MSQLGQKGVTNRVSSLHLSIVVYRFVFVFLAGSVVTTDEYLCSWRAESTKPFVGERYILWIDQENCSAAVL